MKTERDKPPATAAGNGKGLLRADFEHLHACHHEMLAGYFIRRKVPKERARELAQDVWAAGWACRGRYRGEASPKTWLLSIAENILLKERRRQGTQKRNALELSYSDLEEILAQGAVRPDLVAVLEDRRQRDLLRQQIALLPSPAKECCQRRLLFDDSYAEIAARLRLTVGQVRDFLRAGKKRLKEILSPGKQEL